MHKITAYKDQSGEHRWNIASVENDKIVADSGEGYKNREDMLNALFGIFFATYDESFLTLYNEWNPPEQSQNAGVQTPDHIANDVPPVEEQAGLDA